MEAPETPAPFGASSAAGTHPPKMHLLRKPALLKGARILASRCSMVEVADEEGEEEEDDGEDEPPSPFFLLLPPSPLCWFRNLTLL